MYNFLSWKLFYRLSGALERLIAVVNPIIDSCVWLIESSLNGFSRHFIDTVCLVALFNAVFLKRTNAGSVNVQYRWYVFSSEGYFLREVFNVYIVVSKKKKKKKKKKEKQSKKEKKKQKQFCN